jgi:hypothetical protein
MKQTILFLLVASALFSCGEVEIDRYETSDNIYFDFDDEETTNRDSVVFSFAYTPEKTSDTVYLPIRISGLRVGHDRRFKVIVLDDSISTATPVLHYKPLEEFYTISADSGTLQVPVVLYNQDTLLQDKSVSLHFMLVPTEDFGTALPYGVYAKLVFSSRLEKPDWWAGVESVFMDYSRTKHQLYLISIGNIPLIMEGANIPYNLFIMDKFRRFLIDPFTWVQSNPDYQIDTIVEDQEYVLFSKANPTTLRFKIRWDNDAQRYYFIDENNSKVLFN